MRRLFAAIVTLFFALTVQVFAQSAITPLYDWYSGNYVTILRDLNNPRSPNAQQLINDTFYLWENRDGAIGAEVAPAVAAALVHHPARAFSWFERRPTVFAEWLDEMQGSLFIDFPGDGTAEEEALRRTLVREMWRYARTTRLSAHRRMARQVASRASVAHIRTID